MARNPITSYPEPADPGPLFSSQLPVEAEVGHSSNIPGNNPAPISNPLPRSTEVAAIISKGRRQRILQYLVNAGPTTIHEFCTACTSGQVTVHPHQVSGRFTDMAGEGLLTTVGEKPHPVSKCACQIYAITDAGRQELVRLRTNTTRGHGDTETRR